MYNKYLDWAKRYRAIFVSTKYKLIYFTYNSKYFNIGISLLFKEATIALKVYIQVLEVKVDTKLKWSLYA